MRWLLAAVLPLVVASCSRGESTVDPRAHVPEVFAELPGNTCIVLADPGVFRADGGAADADPATPVVASLREFLAGGALDLESGLAESGLVPVESAPDGVLAWAVDGRRTGFPNLRTSGSFQDAVAVARESGKLAAGPLLYVDLQLLVDLAMSRFAADLPGPLRGSLDALGVQSLRWLVATAEPGTDLERDPVRALHGELRSSSTGADLTALLGRGEPAAPLLAQVSGGSGIQVALRFDPKVAQRLLDEIGAAEDQSPLGGMMGGIAGRLRGMLGGLFEVGDGRVALRFTADEEPFEAAFGVRAGADIRSTLGEFGRELDEGRFVLLGSHFLQVDGDRVVSLAEEDADAPSRGEGTLPGSRCVDATWTGSDGAVALQVDRLAPGRLRFQLQRSAPGAGPR